MDGRHGTGEPSGGKRAEGHGERYKKVGRPPMLIWCLTKCNLRVNIIPIKIPMQLLTKIEIKIILSLSGTPKTKVTKILVSNEALLESRYRAILLKTAWH